MHLPSRDPPPNEPHADHEQTDQSLECDDPAERVVDLISKQHTRDEDHTSEDDLEFPRPGGH